MTKLEPNTKYNMLTILSLHHIDKSQKYYECLCNCGNKTIVVSSKLKNSHTKSCGCLKKKVIIERNKTQPISDKHLKNAVEMGASSGERIRKEQLEGKIRPDNTSGVTGVSYDKNLNCWVARLQYRKKSYRIRCSTFKQAVVERKKLEKRFDIYSDEGIKKENDDD